MKMQIDEFGFCNLNSIWKDKELPEKDKPWRWFRLDKTQEFIRYYDIFIQTPEMVCGVKSAAYVVNGGKNPGIYANEMLTLDWAAWVSPALRCEIYKEYLERHRLAESLNAALQCKADALDRMCNKENKLTITQATAEIYSLTGVTISPQRLNSLLKDGGYKFSHWYNNNGGGWCCGVLQRGYVAYKFEVDQKGNKHRGCCLTSRGVQYIAEYLNRHYMSHPLKN